LPSVNKLYTEFKPRGFEVVLVNFREDPAKVKRTAQERGYVAPVLIDQTGDVTGKVYGVWGPPTAYVIDGRGQLLGRLVGARDWSSPAARRFVESLLERSAQR
jgi:AhpC/TSA family